MLAKRNERAECARCRWLGRTRGTVVATTAPLLVLLAFAHEVARLVN